LKFYRNVEFFLHGVSFNVLVKRLNDDRKDSLDDRQKRFIKKIFKILEIIAYSLLWVYK